VHVGPCDFAHCAGRFKVVTQAAVTIGGRTLTAMSSAVAIRTVPIADPTAE
jgi:hypothetical protein